MIFLDIILDDFGQHGVEIHSGDIQCIGLILSLNRSLPPVHVIRMRGDSRMMGRIVVLQHTPAICIQKI